MRSTSFLVAPALALALSGCSAGPAAPGAPGAASAPVAIATTTQLGSVLADITACAGTTSSTLMSPGVDPHEFALSSSAVADLTRAKLVVANGLGLEGGMASALENVKRDGGRVYEVAPDVDPLPFGEHDHEEAGHDHGSQDPHFWMDVARMAKASVNIGAQLKAATGDERYATCGVQVGDKLKGVDAEVRQTLSAVPQAKRILVTDHDACGYFASAYGFTIAGVVIPGGSTDAEPSSADLTKVVDVVRSSGVHAIFSNTAVSPKLVQSVGAEAGGVQVVPLYVDSVGPATSNASTYADMMRANAKLIADALK